MTQLTIDSGLVAEMVDHCLQGRPNEACGLLAALDGRIVHVFKMTNELGSPLRYALVPKEQLAVDKLIDEKGWELGAIFHSHTRTEAYPSPTDVREARVEVPYVIVSLAQDPATVRAFLIHKQDWMAEEGEIEEIPVVIDG